MTRLSLSLLALFLLVPQLLLAQSNEEVMNAYLDGEFESVVERASAIVDSPTASKDDKKMALEYLGRAHSAMGKMAEAQAAMYDLLELEPPLIELDANRETPQLMNAYFEARKDLCGNYTAEPMCGEGPSIRTLAIADFTNAALVDNESYEPMRQGIANLMINQLGGSTDLKLVERERLQWLLEEQNLQRSANVDQRTAVEMGKLLGATYVLFGTYYVQNKGGLFRKRRVMNISMRLVDVSTSEILMTEEVQGKPGDIFDMARSLGLSVAQGINVTLSDDGLAENTNSLDAMMSYNEGIALLETGDYRAAHEKFLEALEYDPTYTQAKVKAESLQPILLASTAAAG
ncbi:MAG: CsgG/HfaB family protein [Bacteroidota bacterium]